MRFCVFGAGAIGSHLAVRLVRGGAEVAVIARGAHVAAIRERGLTLRTPEGEVQVRLRAEEEAQAIGPVDAVLVTTKAPALPDVARCIAPLLGPCTPVAFITNGIPWWYFLRHGGPQDGRRLPRLDPGGVIEREIGIERTLGGVIYAASTVIAPGVVTSEHNDLRLFLGEPDGNLSARAEAIARPLRAGGMPTEVVADLRHRIWGKLLGNLSVGPLCLLSRRDLRTTLGDPIIFAAALRIAEEGAALARAYGYDLAVTPEMRLRRLAAIAHKPSILQDLERGRPMEFDALFTVPLELAAEAGVAMPTFALSARLAMLAAGAGDRPLPAL